MTEETCKDGASTDSPEIRQRDYGHSNYPVKAGESYREKGGQRWRC